MAVGRENTVVGGAYGRLAAPPPGTIYVRDPVAARTLAIQNHIKLFTSQGLPVPEHLTAMAEGRTPVADGDDIVLLDTRTGEVIADVDVTDVDAGEDLPPGAHRAWETAADQGPG